MTWTLRVLDDDGTEIAWVREDPNDFWVDPEVPDASELETYLGQRDGLQYDAETGWETEDGVAHPTQGTSVSQISDWETELHELGTYLVYDFESPSSFSLADE